MCPDGVTDGGDCLFEVVDGLAGPRADGHAQTVARLPHCEDVGMSPRRLRDLLALRVFASDPLEDDKPQSLAIRGQEVMAHNNHRT